VREFEYWQPFFFCRILRTNSVLLLFVSKVQVAINMRKQKVGKSEYAKKTQYHRHLPHGIRIAELRLADITINGFYHTLSNPSNHEMHEINEAEHGLGSRSRECDNFNFYCLFGVNIFCNLRLIVLGYMLKG